MFTKLTENGNIKARRILMSDCLFHILGIPENSSREKIEKTYRGLVRLPQPGESFFAHKHSQANIAHAYLTLTTPEKLAEFKAQQLAEQAARNRASKIQEYVQAAGIGVIIFGLDEPEINIWA